MLDEFYGVAFRIRIYGSIAELPNDLARAESGSAPKWAAARTAASIAADPAADIPSLLSAGCKEDGREAAAHEEYRP